MRLKQWPSRFAALVESVRARPFEWGSHDCCLWAASAVAAVTGVDPASQWRGTYRTERDALRLVATLGGLSGIAAMAGSEIERTHATTADVAIVRWPDGTESLGVCDGQGWLCAGEKGLIVLEPDAALRAWRVA